jgi:hypothetical protein
MIVKSEALKSLLMQHCIKGMKYTSGRKKQRSRGRNERIKKQTIV